MAPLTGAKDACVQFPALPPTPCNMPPCDDCGQGHPVCLVSLDRWVSNSGGPRHPSVTPHFNTTGIYSWHSTYLLAQGEGRGRWGEVQALSCLHRG